MLQYSKQHVEIFELTIEYISNLEEVGRKKFVVRWVL